MAAPSTGVTHVYEDSPNQQSLVLECSICAEKYGPNFDRQPRSLRCGHTFCTKCLMKIMTPRGVKCPMCSTMHPLSSPDVLLLPINHAVQEIVKNISTNDQKSITEQPELPPCGVCHNSPASIVCIDCQPGHQFKFCNQCDLDEHTRPFIPVQRHRRFPIDKAPLLNFTPCSRHSHVPASLYSESLNEFACSECQKDEDWFTRGLHFEGVMEVAKRMRVKIQKLTKYISAVFKEITESKQNLETIMNDLEPASMTVKVNITKTFSKLIEVLQERQKTLLANVEVELKNRKESLMKQYESVVAKNNQYRDAYEGLNSLISEADIDFLVHCQSMTQRVETLMSNEDKSLLRPLVSQDIPFCINKDVERQILTLGAVGGGLTPTEFSFSPSGSQGTMMELLWQLPERCGNLTRFQIEYEQVLDSSAERRGSGLVESPEMVYTQSEPQFYEVQGNELNAYVDYLSPGYSYRFRIRSANDAGLGMWSDPIIAKCSDFPFTLEYTKKIHRIIIPKSSYYRIIVKGAKAADGMIRRGGKGAIISAIISLKAGDILIMLCGGKSSKHHYHSGGGGGSFVALNEISKDTLLIAAGGGGGTRGADENDFDGLDASTEEDGLSGLGAYFGAGGKNGGPGEDARDGDGPSWGNGGAGFMQDSSTALSFMAGGHAGQNGGFGGGGAVGMYGGGGGGGYSGGGGGRGGGGGGSYVIASAVEVTKEVGNEGHGSISIEKVAPPYLASNSHSVRIDSTNTSSSTLSRMNGTSSNHLPVNIDSQMSVSSNNSGSSSGHQMVQIESQISSSSSASIYSSMSSKMLSGSTNISAIPEYDSPASTSQIMDQSGPPPPVNFTTNPEETNGNLDRGVLDPVLSALTASEINPIPSQTNAHIRIGSNQSSAPDLANLLGSYYDITNTTTTTTTADVTTTSTAAAVVEEAAVAVSSYSLGTAMDTSNPSQSKVRDLVQHYQLHDSNPPRVSLLPQENLPVNQGCKLLSDQSTSQWIMQQQFDQDQDQFVPRPDQQNVPQRVRQQPDISPPLTTLVQPVNIMPSSLNQVQQPNRPDTSPPFTSIQQQQQDTSPPLTLVHVRQDTSPPLIHRQTNDGVQIRQPATSNVVEQPGVYSSNIQPSLSQTNNHHSHHNWNS